MNQAHQAEIVAKLTQGAVKNRVVKKVRDSNPPVYAPFRLIAEPYEITHA